MRTQRFAVAALALAMSAGMAAFAAPNEPVKVVPAETLYVIAPHGTFHGAYTTEKDALLLGNAIKALEADKATRNAFLTIVANKGELIVNGTTMDIAQATRIEMKLKGLQGGTKVYAWFSQMTGDGGSAE